MSYGLISALMICLFLFTACGGGITPASISPKPKVSAAEKKAEPAKVAEKKEPDKTAPEKKETAEYTYTPVGKPDPFKPFLQLTSVRDASRSMPQTPLQKYEISQLKLVAIIATREGNIALVEDSVGKGYFLRRGTSIGKNEGKVAKILKDRVVIEEVYQDIFGQTKSNELSLLLHRVEEGGES
jgi:type IV pilus assembly protein PilP